MTLLRLRADFCIVDTTQHDMLIADLDGPVSITNNAEAVVELLARITPYGFGERRLFYRDSTGRFDELIVREGRFGGFAPCSDAQQAEFSKRCEWVELPPKKPTKRPRLDP